MERKTNYKRKMFFSETKIKPKVYQEKLENQIINIYPEITYQTIIGFGGAFTEATGVSIQKLPSDKQDKIIKEYFSKEGLNYSIGRLPIGSSDFSLNSYSYSNKADLSDFSVEKDNNYIIPIVKSTQKINPNIQFFASPWSPPKFMKSNKMLVLGGKLLEKYNQTWANYLVKYVISY